MNFDSPYSADHKLLKPPKAAKAVKAGHATNVFFYMNSMSSMIIPTTLWEATLESPIGIFEAFPAYAVRELMENETEQLAAGLTHCMLAPLDMNCNILITDTEPKIKVSFVFEEIRVRVTSAMVECWRSFFSYFTNA
jgi:hypothetical protein